MSARCYAIVVDDIVVAKRAIGLDETGNYPDPPADAVAISLETYKLIQPNWRFTAPSTWDPPPPKVGRPDTPLEKLTRIEAAAARIRKLIQAFEARLQALEVNLAAIQTDINSLKTFRSQATAKLTNLETRVTALEQV